MTEDIDMKMNFSQATAIAALAMASMTSAVHAESRVEVTTPAAEPELSVVNNHPYRIRVVMVDRDGQHHTLGHVAPSAAGLFDLDDFRLDGRPVRLKVIVDEPVWSPGNSGQAVRTRSIYLGADDLVLLWVEPDLAASEVEVITTAR